MKVTAIDEADAVLVLLFHKLIETDEYIYRPNCG